jgi:hypothetical protein
MGRKKKEVIEIEQSVTAYKEKLNSLFSELFRVRAFGTDKDIARLSSEIQEHKATAYVAEPVSTVERTEDDYLEERAETYRQQQEMENGVLSKQY